MELEGIIKLAAIVIGMIVYQFVKKGDTKKKKTIPTQPKSPISMRRPQPAPVIEETYEIEEPEIRDEPEDPRTQLVTFEELLEQFGKTKKKKELTRREKEVRNGMDDEFIPATDTQLERQQELNQYYNELGDDKFRITEEDLKDHRDSDFRLKKDGKNQYAQILKNPKNIKNLFIASEIFQRKF